MEWFNFQVNIVHKPVQPTLHVIVGELPIDCPLACFNYSNSTVYLGEWNQYDPSYIVQATIRAAQIQFIKPHITIAVSKQLVDRDLYIFQDYLPDAPKEK